MTTSGSIRLLIESNRRILIVDDNRSIHEDFRKILGGGEPNRGDLNALHEELFGAVVESQNEVFELDSAYQGEEALEKVKTARDKNQPYALIFIDVRMPPGLDGIQTTARLLKEDPEVGIVICSAYSDHSWEEMTATFGKTDRILILKKPFDTVEVRQLAHALRRRWELARLAELKVSDLTAVIDATTRELKAANEALKEEAAAREDALRRLGESNEQIRALAYQDGLTGLPNRRLFNEHLEKVLARARRKSTEFAVLFIDVDNFKLINDTVGHQAADEVLRQLAESLSDLTRSDDVLGLYMDNDIDLETTITVEPIVDSVLSRLGGDEFIILLPDTRDRFAAGAVARRVLKHLEQPIRVDSREVFVTASIGIATYPEDGVTGEILIRNADTAMYHAKQQGKASFQYYSAAMNAASVERLTLESGLRRALEDQGLELHYQPQIDVRTGWIVGAEALLRWNHPLRGHISPATFIPIAEDSGLILPIGEWVLNRACQQAVEWQRAGLPKIPVAVNVSGVQFRRQDLCKLVKDALSSSGLDASLLRLEITETVIVSVRDRAVQLLEQLRDLGISLALDDFGTGYSSLSYLKSFPINMLKIDRSFVAEMLTDHTTASIVEAIISMTRILGLTVLAEGVEDQAQFAFLKKLGCDMVQGFYVSAAVPAEEFGEMLRSFESASILPVLPGKMTRSAAT
ncbi:MAG TPA: EAL domain-containing protein [Gammaproteobacteria bacterium]|nr:EAL domain-containing protein [Gammaproteobacteria bacterium]